MSQYDQAFARLPRENDTAGGILVESRMHLRGSHAMPLSFDIPESSGNRWQGGRGLYPSGVGPSL